MLILGHNVDTRDLYLVAIMPSKASLGSRSPSVSSVALPASQSRRSSVNSPIDQETLSLALDHIHTTASRSDALTTFDEYSTGVPPRGVEGKSLASDLVQGGITGLYSRLKASVGAARDVVTSQPLTKSQDSPDHASVVSVKSKATATTSKSSTSTVVSSPLAASASSSRIQSPLTSSFPKIEQSLVRSSNVGSASSLPNAAEITQHDAVDTRTRPQGEAAETSEPILKPKPVERSTARGISEIQQPQLQMERPKQSPNPPFRPPIVGASSTGAFDHRQEDEYTAVRPDEVGSTTTPQALDHDSRREFPALERIPTVKAKVDENVGVDKPVERKSTVPSQSAAPADALERARMQNTQDSYLAPQRPPLLQISQSHLPGFRPSRANSSDGDFSSVVTAVTPSTLHNFTRSDTNGSKGHDISYTHEHDPASHLRNKLVSKELWMRDENAKDCFYCGDAFSAFRRKHHCRTCGNIFDSKCTSLVPGKLFGQSGRVRVCKPCESMIYGTDDDSSVYTEEVDRASLAGHTLSTHDVPDVETYAASDSASTNMADELANIGRPSIAVPMSRKQGNESKRRSAVIEFDNHQHSLGRPSSSRSLRSLSGRPRSNSHKRHNSRQGHQHMKSLKSSEERAPFQRQDTELSPTKSTGLPAFHHDNIIDPDLAPFMSDEGSSDEENPSLFAALNGEGQSPGKQSEKSGFGGLLASVRKGTSRANEKHTSGMSMASRDADNASILSRNPPHRNRPRALSVSSIRPSPRRSKSNSLLKGFNVGFGNQPTPHIAPYKSLPMPPKSNSKMIRSAAMRGADAPAVELNQASLQHVQRLLRQMLEDGNVTSTRRWEKALMPILLQCTDDVNPDIQRNDDIDIRHYIKLKKVPGGKPGDTSYVSGVVFTKNLALKSMPRSIAHPRIVIVTFAIEYARYHQHFMSLDPVLAQEREYLRNLVKRIIALNPQVLLVEKNVAGLALDLLAEANIAVAYNVKPSVLSAVSRCTQTKLITSVDKLNIDPSHVGRCASFDVKTYVHGPLKKTYIYLSGCQPDLGCTIVLRGAETEELRRLKRITEFMCYVVYNLKLETCVMRDEYVLIPANVNDEQGTTELGETALLESRRNTRLELMRGSPVENGHISKQLSDTDLPSFAEDIVQRHRTRIVSSSPFVKFMQPYLLSKVREQEAKLERLANLRDQYNPDRADDSDEGSDHEFELVKPEMINTVVDKPSKQVRDFLFAVHDAEYNKASHLYLTLRRQWEASCGNTKLFDPFNHQRIAVLYSMVNTKTSNPCVGPDVIALSFYSEHDLDEDFLPDITLGQYVEDLCNGANTQCSAPGCEDNLFSHHRQYVHGDGQMSVMVQKYPSRIRGMHNTILMWSCCRICGQETQVIPMSENTWKYSFGKYLELTFWSTALHPRAHACPHDIHRDHVRFFGFNNVVIRIQFDPVILHEVIVPRPTINWKVDSDLRLKNEQYQRFKDRLDKFMTSVKARIESIHVDSVVPEKVEDCRAEVESLLKRANDDHISLTKNLQEKYMKSRYYEIIPLNRAGRAIHENSLAWDEAFANFEQNFFPSEKDIRKMAEQQLKKMFIKQDESMTSMASVEEGSEPATEMKNFDDDGVSGAPEVTRRLSAMSPEDTENVLNSVIKEQRSEKLPTEELRAAVVANDRVLTNPATSPQPSRTPIEAVEGEEVKHLDLAVPADFPSPHLSKPDIARPSGVAQDDESSSTGKSADTTTDADGLKLSPEITKSVQHMRNNSDNLDLDENALTETKIMASRIPRPTEGMRRDGSQVAPPLSRAQSTPQGAILPRLRQEYGDVPSGAQSPTPSTNSKSDRFRNLITDARALERRMADRLGSGTLRAGRTISQSLIPRSTPANKKTDSRVSTLAKHFEQLSREFEKQRMRERQQAARGRRAYPLASSKPIVEVYKDEHEAVRERESSDDGPRSGTPERTSLDTSSQDQSSFAETAGTTPTDGDNLDEGERADVENTSPDDEKTQGATVEGEQNIDDQTADASDTERTVLDDIEVPESVPGTTPLTPTDSSLDISVELPKHEKTSIMKLLTSFWSERSASGWVPLEYPFASYEHVWQDSDIIVREDEPSSIIALALSSPDYQAKMKAFRSPPLSIDAESETESIERNLVHPKNTNIRYAFRNRGVSAQCKIFFAESFDALRRKTGVSERIVESLSRCLKWDSKGGKTKSLFLKTLDDRFVLKSLSAVEVTAFFKLAPEYFFFIHQNLFTQLPSVIAKIFGLFQVTIRNPANNMEFNWFMIVMENLFYDRHTNRRFDLKGSMRNRKIQSTGEKDEVLLDENLVDIIFEKPIFVREHTMKTLKNSVYNDTLFLSKQNVMDYSLMAGFDDENREIVVGIIDTIRTYTWDKKLETWIKDRGKNKPTVTSPKDYRNRFRIAMSKYILQAPDCWHQFQTSLPPARQVRSLERREEVLPEEQEVEIGT